MQICKSACKQKLQHIVQHTYINLNPCGCSTQLGFGSFSRARCGRRVMYFFHGGRFVTKKIYAQILHDFREAAVEIYTARWHITQKIG
jgi:hypothetical protein